MTDTMNLQDSILKEVIRDRVPVTLFLMNGFQLRGFVTGFDSFVVVLVSDGKQQMIYKHAISTLAPMKPLKAAATNAYANRRRKLLRRLFYLSKKPFGLFRHFCSLLRA